METILQQNNNLPKEQSKGNFEKKIWAEPEITLISSASIEGGPHPGLHEATTSFGSKGSLS
ncbi:hypothetical protein BEL04_02150 [Mucilaginibacter sp. PPCGB 2223]|uniref:hypothetical protein n=1 Tax=Mucilaginibacter sp. PPCGB 2223 TaxID=1886027 RepID=UPI000825D1D4|nr:hypothetical protein [Mucilaginibacter sp. PPCGB 2223]OCX53139.1 hypothetical protein BEL04_02150 [Mucilaginibacter sp. PPCGB 2223]